MSPAPVSVTAIDYKMSGMTLFALPILLLPIAALAQIRGAMNPAPDSSKPQPVRNDVAQAGEEIVTLRTFHIKKGTFDQFLKASQEDVWPYFEKIGSRIIGMWLVFDPNNSGPAKDYDEVNLMTRYASVEHWRATRDATLLGGNGPDWEKCRRGLDIRQGLTISSGVVFMKGSLNNKPYFMPGLKESYEPKK
jgi:NIPSNAP